MVRPCETTGTTWPVVGFGANDAREYANEPATSLRTMIASAVIAGAIAMTRRSAFFTLDLYLGVLVLLVARPIDARCVSFYGACRRLGLSEGLGLTPAEHRTGSSDRSRRETRSYSSRSRTRRYGRFHAS